MVQVSGTAGKRVRMRTKRRKEAKVKLLIPGSREALE
jgi:hypothetical protein